MKWRYAPTLAGFLLWIEDCRRLVRDDDDNLILFSGETGSGKSTVEMQILKLLDPEGFGVDRVQFTIEGFMEAAPRTPKFGALCADEFLASRRKAMHSQLIELNDFFQYCRQWNLQMAVCFPHEHRMDLPILEDRVKWLVDVVERGVFILYQRVVKKSRAGGKLKVDVQFYFRGKWTFDENEGAFWDAYLAKKDRHFKNRGIEVGVQPEEVKAAARAASPEELGFEPGALRDAFARYWREGKPGDERVVAPGAAG